MQPDINSPRKSAANIRIARKPAQAPASGRSVLERLIDLKRDCELGGNKNDTADALIQACIGSGICGKQQIIATLNRIGVNPRHVAVLLKKGRQAGSGARRWERDGRGVYSLSS